MDYRYSRWVSSRAVMRSGESPDRGVSRPRVHQSLGHPKSRKSREWPGELGSLVGSRRVQGKAGQIAVEAVFEYDYAVRQ